MVFLAAPALLAFAALASVPIILHFLRRRHREEVSFAAMQFLQQAIDSRSQTSRLWQRILLLLRILAIVAIALGLASPMWETTNTGEAGAENPPSRLWVLVIDTSGSMRAIDPQGEVLFRKAIESAETLVRSGKTLNSGQNGSSTAIPMRSQDRFLLLAMGDRGEAIIGRATSKRDGVLEALRSLQCGYGVADVNDTLTLLEDLLPEESNKVSVRFFTDFQKTSWGTPSLTSRIDNLLMRIDDFQVIPTSPTQKNKSVSSLSLALRDGSPALLPSLGGIEESTSLALTVECMDADGNQKGKAAAGVPIRIPAELNQRLVPYRVVLKDEKNQSDGLAIDDQQWVVIRHRYPRRIDCIGDADASAIVATALRASSSNDRTRDEIRLLADSALSISNDDRPTDVLIYCNPGRLLPDQREALLRVRRNGGAVIWWLGNQTLPGEFDRLAEWGYDAPIRLKQPSQRGLFGIDPRRYQHPAVRAFRPHPESGLLTMPIYRYWQIAPRRSLSETVSGGVEIRHQNSEESVLSQDGVLLQPVLTLRGSVDNGTSDPNSLDSKRINALMVAAEDANGKSVFFTSAPEIPRDQQEPWNGMVAWPSFVPLLRETVNWTAPHQSMMPSLTVGNQVIFSLPTSSLASLLPKNTNPSLQRSPNPSSDAFRSWTCQWLSAPDVDSGVPVTMDFDTQPLFIRFALGEVAKPGLHWLRLTNPGRTRIRDSSSSLLIPVAVNMDPRESELEPYDTEWLRELNQLQQPKQVVAVSTSGDTIMQATSSRRLFRWLVMSGILLLAAEVFVSRFVLPWDFA